jgi:16S rRNA G966 N2-methylase RsmD
MPDLPETLIAAKHPPEYRLHKYWARKPSNVVAAFLRALAPPGGRVLDPFCGSGVVLAEARALGLTATGIDLNPAAALIAGVTANPPDPGLFDAALADFLEAARAARAAGYRLPAGGSLRYAVHSLIAACPACGTPARAWDIPPVKRQRRCPVCGAILRFNLAGGTASAVVEIVTTAGERRHDPALLAHQQAASHAPGRAPSAFMQTSLLPNRRILAHPGLTAADLFTPRARHAAEVVRGLLDAAPESVRPALSALTCAALAGFSRLIPYRAGLSGGGPAWSVPGFWVAPVHIEHNPLLLLDSWARRYRAGLGVLNARLDGKPPATVIQAPAQVVLHDLGAHSARFDLVFLDPPYGDSVPYLEFSALWNAFLSRAAEYGREVVVSDREVQPAGWAIYEARLAEVIAASAGLLAPGGAVVVTFNNLDGRAWAALLRALHGAGLLCAEIHYVAPAVISAKAQFAPEGSYQGDFWAVFRPGARPAAPAADWAELRTAGLPPEVVEMLNFE